MTPVTFSADYPYAKRYTETRIIRSWDSKGVIGPCIVNTAGAVSFYVTMYSFYAVYKCPSFIIFRAKLQIFIKMSCDFLQTTNISDFLFHLRQPFAILVSFTPKTYGMIKSFSQTNIPFCSLFLRPTSGAYNALNKIAK